jgi:hypothetical protein
LEEINAISIPEKKAEKIKLNTIIRVSKDMLITYLDL